MRLLLPWMKSSASSIAAMDEVITTLLMDGCFKEELRIEIVPWMAGTTMSLSVSSLCTSHQRSSLLWTTGK